MKKYPLYCAIAAFALTGFLASGQNKEQKKVSDDTALARNLNTFNTVTRYIAEAYVDSLRPDEAFDAAIAAMLNTVDPYTEYYNSNERQRLEVMTTGAYGGIGAFITTKDGNTYISLPIQDSPSYKAGLKGGDKILRVDSTSVEGKASDFTTRLLKGDPGTMVTVTVQRPYAADSILTFNIMRERVQEKSVPFYGVIDGNIGYVKLNSFMEKTPQEIKTALEKFRDAKVKGVVLDLRSNGGGLVESALELLGMVLPRNTQVLEMRGNTPDSYRTFTTKGTPIVPDLPLVVLIDEGSASASEITAGAIQDLDRGLLVGQRSFGKGLVQSTISLPYDALLKVTTAKYHLPSGRLIQALDYSRRNPDGSVARTPDSLTNEFRTLHGRIVRDGGGLIPDSTVEVSDYSRLLYNLMMSNQIFDFATKYAATHPTIPAAGDFRITDEIFDEFVAFVDTTKVKNDKIGHRLLDELRRTADNEGFKSDDLTKAIDAMEALVEPDLSKSLYNRRDEISEFLGREIVARYYNRWGEEEYSLNFDKEFEVAKDLINNPELYNSLLQPRK